MASPLLNLATRAPLVWALCSLGCTTPGPTPAEFAAQELPPVEPGAAGHAEVQRETQAAMLALLAGRPGDAEARADAAIALDPRAARARAIRGRAIVEAARRDDPMPLAALERAEGELRLARRLDPLDPEIHLLQAQFLEIDGHPSLAVAVLEELLSLAPDHLEGLRAASRLHFELGHERRALPRLRAVLAVTPSDAAMVFRLAQSEFRLAESAQQGDFDVQSTSAEVAREGYLRAAQAYREHVGLRPLDLAGYLGEAAARFRAAGLLGPQEIERIESERQQVEVILNHAVAVAPGSPAPHHGLGWLFEQRDDTGRARAAYEDALRLDQDYLPSILNLARLLDATGEKKSARDSCRRALLLNVNDAERRRLRQYLGQFPPPPGPARSP